MVLFFTGRWIPVLSGGIEVLPELVLWDIQVSLYILIAGVHTLI